MPNPPKLIYFDSMFKCPHPEKRCVNNAHHCLACLWEMAHEAMNDLESDVYDVDIEESCVPDMLHVEAIFPEAIRGNVDYSIRRFELAPVEEEE